MLLEGGGEVITREEIRKKLWSEDTIVEFGHSVDTAMKKLRQALGDDADKPRYIETLPRRGYRWLVPIEWVGTSTVGSPATVGPLGVSQTAGVEQLPARAPTRDAVEEGQPWYSRASWHWLLIASLSVVFGLGLVAAIGPRTFKSWFQGPTAAPDIRSLAVLPLQNLSGDPKQEYFADGMTEELIAELGQVSALRVISRTSVMTYKGTKKRLPEIARELGVDGVVEGSVLREGNHVRVTAQLIDARSDQHLWARSYDRDLTSILALQGEVAQAIADAIRIEVTPQEKTRLARARPVSRETQDLYLQGMQLLNQAHLKPAIVYLQQAVDSDPNYAPAHAALAHGYGWLGEAGRLPYAEAFTREETEAAKAIELDDALSEGHAELASAVMNLDWDWTTPEREYRRALELNPNSVPVYSAYTFFLERIGRIPEAIEEMKRVLEHDPVSSNALAIAGTAYYWARQYDEGLAQIRRGSTLDPDNPQFRFPLGDIYAEKGMYGESIAEFQKFGDQPHALGHIGNAYARAGRTAEARATIPKLEEHVRKDGLGTYEIALVYAGLGKKDEAFAWLGKAFAAHDKGITFLKVDPPLDPLRSDPRFKDLVRRVGLPP